MLSNEFLQQLSQKAAAILPGASSVQKELETKVYELLQASFAKLNLVTREEFDSQLAILEKSQHTISILEGKISALEQQNSNPSTPDAPHTIAGNTDSE